MPQPPDAPRLRAYLQRAESNSVLVMPREAWNRFQVSYDVPVAIDILQTPMSAVASKASLIGVVAQQFSTASAEVTIYRDDPKDAPNRINSDPYAVWLDLPSHQSFDQMLQAASTSDNTNLRQFLNENVLLIKRGHGPGHRATELPDTVRIALERPSSTSGAA
jgi:hypothetical protein